MVRLTEKLSEEVIGNGLWRIEWLQHRCRHVTLKGQDRDLSTLRGQYLENSWICYLTTIANC